MGKFLNARNIYLQLRIRVLKYYVCPTLLYGFEIWTLRGDMMNQLDAVEMLVLERMLRLSETDKVTNGEVYIKKCRQNAVE